METVDSQLVAVSWKQPHTSSLCQIKLFMMSRMVCKEAPGLDSVKDELLIACS